jgi:D-glycero-alpha-D-manno-heptose-7-phosphate kinase
LIISRTPLRVSFAGGGSDLRAFYAHDTGAVLSTAIDKYIYITVNRKFDDSIRASYSRTEIVRTVDDVQHELIRESLKQVRIDGGIEVTSISDIPSEGTGLGSSSTYTVGLLNALHAHTGRSAGAERLAREACEIEIVRCAKPIGKQDQYIAAYGGLQFIQFNADESVFVDPVVCDPQTKRTLHERLLMFYTGLTRSADSILEEQRQNIQTDDQRREALRSMTSLAHELRECLVHGRMDSFGDAMHQAWLLKTRLASGITSSTIDQWYERARANGAIGGKILGAGGGGFLLLYAPRERHDDIRRALSELRNIPFNLEPQGSKIIYVEEGGYAHGPDAVARS